jgi:hypothetical protein
VPGERGQQSLELMGIQLAELACFQVAQAQWANGFPM